MSYTYIEESQAYQQYDDMLDELYPDQVGNILASRILKDTEKVSIDKLEIWNGTQYERVQV